MKGVISGTFYRDKNGKKIFKKRVAKPVNKTNKKEKK